MNRFLIAYLTFTDRHCLNLAPMLYNISPQHTLPSSFSQYRSMDFAERQNVEEVSIQICRWRACLKLRVYPSDRDFLFYRELLALLWKLRTDFGMRSLPFSSFSPHVSLSHLIQHVDHHLGEICLRCFRRSRQCHHEAVDQDASCCSLPLRWRAAPSVSFDLSKTLEKTDRIPVRPLGF